LAALIQYGRSKVENYVTAGRDTFRILVGAALTPVQVLAELISIFAPNPLAPSKNVPDIR
jgi:hypothetical protein